MKKDWCEYCFTQLFEYIKYTAYHQRKMTIFLKSCNQLGLIFESVVIALFFLMKAL